MIAAASLWIVLSAAPAKAALYLYEINASHVGDPTSSITASFTMDSSIGPTSISNVDIHGTISGPFNFSFNGVFEPDLTWPIVYGSLMMPTTPGVRTFECIFITALV